MVDQHGHIFWSKVAYNAKRSQDPNSLQIPLRGPLFCPISKQDGACNEPCFSMILREHPILKWDWPRNGPLSRSRFCREFGARAQTTQAPTMRGESGTGRRPASSSCYFYVFVGQAMLARRPTFNIHKFDGISNRWNPILCIHIQNDLAHPLQQKPLRHKLCLTKHATIRGKKFEFFTKAIATQLSLENTYSKALNRCSGSNSSSGCEIFQKVSSAKNLKIIKPGLGWIFLKNE